ncbi:MAG TPA: AI-2E family transporter [Ktedonobacterales bacterium]|jgi:predicted PurR-regulated permease PerM|nr:AI-2E family transporter [Ktedonobacterales bacterium]
MRDSLQRHRSLRALVALGIIALIIYIIQAIWSALAIVGNVFLIFLLAWIVTFILAPLSGRLERLGAHRIAAVSAIYLALLVAVVGIASLAVPVVEAEITHLAARLSVALSPHAGANGLNEQIAAILRYLGFTPADANALGAQTVSQAQQVITSLSTSTVGSATQIFSTVGTVVFDATLIIIISFYMMLQGDVLVEKVITRLPPKWLPDARLFQRNINEIFAGFFRAQVIVGAIYAALTWIILAFFGLGDAWFVALVAGALLLLPFIGAFLAVVPPLLLLAVVTPPSQLLIKLALVGLLLGAAQHVVLNVIAPRIFGQHMRVPTLILFAALLLGAGEGGVWGAFFAGPVMAVAYAMLEVFYERFSAGSPLFQNDDEDDEDAPGAPKLDPANAAPQPDLWASPEGRPAYPKETLKSPEVTDAQGANQGR